MSSRSVGKTSLRQKGSHLGFCHFVSKSQGKRLMRDGVQLGRKDRLRSVWQETLEPARQSHSTDRQTEKQTALLQAETSPVLPSPCAS